MPNIGAPELIIVLVIALVLFGGAKLPKLARSLGEAQKEFKAATDHEETDSTSRTAEQVREDELRRREDELRRREEELRRIEDEPR